MDWIFKGKPATVIPKGKIGFVYITRYTDGSYYIGKKIACSMTSLAPLKSGVRPGAVRRKRFVFRDSDGKVIVTNAGKQAARNRGEKATMEPYDWMMTEKKWREYEGSSKLAKAYTLADKEILAWCNTNQGMTFIEADLQIRNNVLFDEKCLNQNILGKFYPNVLEGEKLNDED